MSIQEKNKPLAENIKKMIVNRGLKQGFVARIAGYSESEFSAMLNGRKIIIASDLPKIAKALEVTPNELCGVVNAEDSLGYTEQPEAVRG